MLDSSYSHCYARAMMRWGTIIALVVCLGASAVGQSGVSSGGNVALTNASGVPSGTCSSLQLYNNTLTGMLYNCVAGSWNAIGGGGGGGGTVTTFSAGDLSPLFTSSVANPTSTPALSFSLTNAAAGTLFGNNGASSGAPAYTIAPVLGVAGSSVGSIGFNNLTSGTVTLRAVTGALGTVTVSLPAATDTLVGLSTPDTLANKTLTAPTIASFTNATHNHTNAAGGGQLTDAALSAAVGTAKGGTGTDSSAAGGVPTLRSGTWEYSGDANHEVTWCASGCTNAALTTTLGATTICDTTHCPAGLYNVFVYIYSAGTGCTTVGAGQVSPRITFTDDVAAKSAIATTLGGGNVSAGNMVFTTGGGANGFGSWQIYSNGSAAIQISTVFAACTTPGSFNGYDLRASVAKVG